MTAVQTKQGAGWSGLRPAPLALDEDAELVLNIDSSYKELYEARCTDYTERLEKQRRYQFFEEGDVVREGTWSYQVMRIEGMGMVTRYARLVSYSGTETNIDVPSTLGGLEVEEIGDRAFARNKHLRSLRMPNTVRRMGKKVFSIDFELEEVWLSDSIEELDRSVFEHCRALKELHLPSRLRKMPDKLLWDCGSLKNLLIPASVEQISRQACQFDRLPSFTISPQNPYLKTDGTCLYSADGKRLISVLVDITRYQVLNGCEEICDDTFKNMRSLNSIGLPDSLVCIGERAFSRTGISRIELPPSIEVIKSQAFYQCSRLSSCNFPRGLKSIGGQAFASTRLTKALLPASLQEIGSCAFSQTNIRFGNSRSFSIDPDNPTLKSDGTALYNVVRGKRCLTGMLRDVDRYKVAPGTVEICSDAFAHSGELLSVELPEGLTTIGDHAFADSPRLSRVELPESVERIDTHAFFKTNVSSLRIGKNLRFVGDAAFCTASADYNSATNALKDISVDPENPIFYKEGNILCMHRDFGDAAIAAVGSCNELHIPPQVDTILDLAFAKAYVRDLYIHKNICVVSLRAFLNLEGVERIHIEFPREVDGFSQVTVSLPKDRKSTRWYVRALRMDNDGLFFDFAAYDAQICREEDPVEKARLILERMDAPVKLSERTKAIFRGAIASSMHDLSRELMHKRDMKTFERLADYEFISNRNIDSLVEKAAAWQETEACAFLLEMKKKRFSFTEDDFSF